MTKFIRIKEDSLRELLLACEEVLEDHGEDLYAPTEKRLDASVEAVRFEMVGAAPSQDRDSPEEGRCIRCGVYVCKGFVCALCGPELDRRDAGL